MSNNKKAIVHGILAVLIFGSLPTSIRFVSANTYSIAIFRLTVTVFVLSLLFLFKKKELLDLIAHWKALVPIGFFFGFHWYTYFESIKIASASIGAIGLSSYGIYLIILGLIFEKARGNLIDYLAILLAVSGNLVIIREFTLSDSTTLGLLYGLISGFSYALLPILHKRSKSLPLSLRTLGQFTFALLLFVPFVGRTSWQMTGLEWLVMLHLGLVCTLVGHSLWVSATTNLPTTTSALIYYGQLPTALLLSFLLLGESLDSHVIVGTSMILAANLISVIWGAAFRKIF